MKNQNSRREISAKSRDSIALSELAEDAIDVLMPFARVGFLSDKSARRALLNQVLHEGLFALADRLEETGKYRLILRFDACGEGERRGFAREREDAQIDAILAEASR